MPLQDKGLKVLFDLAALKLPTASTVVVGRKSWADANRPLLQKYVDSVLQGIARARDDKPGTVGVMKQYYQLEDDRAIGATYDFFLGEVIPAQPLPRLEQIQEVLASLPDKAESPLNLTSALDDSYVRSAVDRGLTARP